MRRIRSTYHTLHVLKSVYSKLRKAIVANCNKDNLKGICECALNVLHGNIPLTACGERKLQKNKSSFRKLADGHVSLSAMSNVINQRAGFLLPLFSAILPTLAGILFRSRQ